MLHFVQQDRSSLNAILRSAVLKNLIPGRKTLQSKDELPEQLLLHNEGFSLRDYFTATLSDVSMARSEDRSPHTYDRRPLFNRDLVIIRHAHRELRQVR